MRPRRPCRRVLVVALADRAFNIACTVAVVVLMAQSCAGMVP